jgi:hypothetical protein
MVPVANGFPSAEMMDASEQGRLVLGGCRPRRDRQGCPDCYPTEAWQRMGGHRRPAEGFEGSSPRGPGLLD